MATFTTVPKDLGDTMGAFYIGVVFSGILFGTLTMQVFAYYRSRSWSDPISLRLLVFSIWGLDAMHQIFVSHAIYRYLVSNFLNGAHLDRVLWTAMMEVLVTGIIAMLVHGFYVTRVYQLSNRNWFIAGPLALGAVAEFVFATIFSAKAVAIGSYTNFSRVKNWLIVSNATFAGVSLAFAAVYFVYLQSQPTRIKQSSSVLVSGLTISLDTGLLAGIIALVSLVAFITSQSTFIYAPFAFCLGRLYAISLLYTLNVTGPKGGKPSTVSADSKNIYQPRQERHRMSNFAGRSRAAARDRDVSVHIDTVQYVNHDGDFHYAQDKEKATPVSQNSETEFAAAV